MKWISIQFNWIRNQNQHQFWSIHVDIKTISFQQTNSISNQFDSLRFTSIQFQFQFTTFQFNFNSMNFQFNSILFRFYSIQLHENWSYEAWKGPPLRQAENWNFSKGFVIKKYWFFAGRQISIFLIFQVAKKRTFCIAKMIDFDRFLVEIWESKFGYEKCPNSIWFSGGEKTGIFHYKNNRFWSFFGRNLRIPDLDTKNVRIPYDFQVAKKRTFLITKTIDFDHFLIQIGES